MRLVMLILYLILIVLGVTFAVLNAGSVDINFYIGKVTLPLSILMVIMLGIGLLIGSSLFLCRYWCLRLEYNKLRNQDSLTPKPK